MNTGRLAGIILIVASILILIAAVAVLGTQLFSEESATAGGQMLGLVMVFLFVVVPIAAVGVYLLVRGQAEEEKMSQARLERDLLNMVLTQGKVSFAEVALELSLTRSEVEDIVRDLVGKQLFTGAVNWNDGILYSKEASQLKKDHLCPNCGGELTLAGKGVIVCPYCGAEVFLHLD
ncbi:MAG TPA: zinc ribbon domain-containing protein [Caldilineae bacterium]|nr:zinc ribbon domain-containing protein [Caldilineae bacterium]